MGNNLTRRVQDANTGGDTKGKEVVEVQRHLGAQISKMKEQFQAAMPKGMEATQLIRDALTALRTQRNLPQCDELSVLGGLMTFAQLGLRPHVPSLGHGWLLPFWDKHSRGFKAQVVIGYKGYAALAYRTGGIASLVGREVRQEDFFDVEYGVEEFLKHKPARPGPRGEVTDYYTIVRYTGGSATFWHMTKVEAEEHRDRYAMARTKEGAIIGPWRDHFDAMAIKGLALDTLIPTPTGWTTIGRVEVGDQVLDMYGQPTNIVVKSQVKNLDCYRVNFGNGESIVCDAEHRWLAKIGGSLGRRARPTFGVRSGGWSVYEIGELYEAKQSGTAVTVPVTHPLTLPDADLPLDPWVLGYWLGDGSRSAPVLTCHMDDQAEVVVGIRSAGYEVGAIRPARNGSSCVSVYIKGIKKILADLGVLGNKHVPAAYLRGSDRQRLALLRGLMDSDGTIDSPRSRACFTNTNPALSNAVAELARSLGEMIHRMQVSTHGFGRDVLTYQVGWTPNLVPVTLARKAVRVRPRKMDPFRVVRSIERVSSVPTQCIGVDSLTHTFLAGEDMVPTHNTTFLKLARWMPKSTELEAAIAADESVRYDLSGDSLDSLFHGEKANGDFVDGEVVPDDEPASAAVAEPPPADTAPADAAEPPAADEPPAAPRPSKAMLDAVLTSLDTTDGGEQA